MFFDIVGDTVVLAGQMVFAGALVGVYFVFRQKKGFCFRDSHVDTDPGQRRREPETIFRDATIFEPCFD